MFCQNTEELQELVTETRPLTKIGKVANYIPELEKAQGSDLSIAIYDLGENRCLSAGDVHKLFTLQSISKVITLALAILDHGEQYVFQHVGMEPTGDPFNSIIKLETMNPSKPLNPMINAGALVVTNLIKGESVKDKLNRILTFVRTLTNNPSLSYNEKVAHSEFETAHLNRALCYYMKQHGVLVCNVEEVIELYTKQCAIETACSDLARIGAVFANDGICPTHHHEVIPKHISRICKTFMVTCGMYNASGEFAIKVGIPAKSGVSGGILGIVPNRAGIGIYGPALDGKGNSVAGLELLQVLSKRYQFSMF